MGEEGAKEKIKGFFAANSVFIVVIFVLLFYVFTGVLELNETGQSVGQIIGDGGLFFAISMLVLSLMTLQGLLDGDKDSRVLATNTAHGKIIMEMAPYTDLVDEWCELKNAENLKLQRTRILASVGLKYDDCFDKDGVELKYPLEEKPGKVTDRKNAAYLKAIFLELPMLDSGTLMSGGNGDGDGYYLKKSKGKYALNAISKKAVMKFALAILVGVYGVQLVSNFSWLILIWTGIQAGICLVSGIAQRLASKMFVTEDLRSQTIRKINFLEMCRCDIQNNPDLFVKSKNVKDRKITINKENDDERYGEKISESYQAECEESTCADGCS